jgi:hypothetical protein
MEVKVIAWAVVKAWKGFKMNELYGTDAKRSQTTINNYLESFKNHIIPK